MQPTVLLGEDLSDANALHQMAKAGAVLAGWGYLPLAANPAHGGGSKTNVVLGSYASTADRLCVCVVDSDRVCPTASLGQTAAAVQPFKQSDQYPLVSVLETTGRDLENALPDSFYRASYGDGAPTPIFEHLTSRSEWEARAHLDVEKGFTLRALFAYRIGSPERVFWDGKLPVLVADPSRVAPTLPCSDTGRCMEPATSPCKCEVLTGNRSDVLRRFVADWKSLSPYQMAEQLDASVRGEWLRIGAEIAAWCCADTPLRV